MGKYANKSFIDTRDGLRWDIVSYYTGGSQLQYWVEQRRPRGKKILKKTTVYESTLTKLQNFLKEI